MAGSGTVVRQAADLGHNAIGYDMDPLAVLMSRVWTTPVRDSAIEEVASIVISRAQSLRERDIYLPWIDDDQETSDFINYWFGSSQQAELRRLAFAISSTEAHGRQFAVALDALRIALSRLIITKESGASLARDVSHSRPHRVSLSNDYHVLFSFKRSIDQVRMRLKISPPTVKAQVRLGDARKLSNIKSGSVDLVMTSPPYLNAIDYLRGHRLSLVWLGHTIGELRSIRSESIGAERGTRNQSVEAQQIRSGMGDLEDLPTRFSGMVDRYVDDMRLVMSETARVLRSGGKATFVVGNSCVRGVFIRNSVAVKIAARLAGLRLVAKNERALPSASRYLPVTSDGALAKRMRTETILTFSKN